MTKEELKKELKSVKILYVVGISKGTNPRWDKGIWRKFRVYYFKNGNLKHLFISPQEEDMPPYWNKKGGLFECKALGSDRVFEIVYSLGNWLFGDGYRFKGEFLSWE